MIGPLTIADHLRRYLPVVTDIFSYQLTATATASGNTVTATSVGHGLTVGRLITVAGGTLQNNIVSIIDNGDGTARFETGFNHDLTEPKAQLDPTTLKIGGTGTAWDGEHEIVSIPNRKFFEVAIPDGLILPVGGYLDEQRSYGINGIHEVATVPDANTFTFVTSGPILPTGPINDINIVSGANIDIVADVQRAEKIYTKQANEKPVVFVIMTDATSSKSRMIENDGIANNSPGTDKRIVTLNNFSTVVFFPCNNNAGAAQQQNDAYTTVFEAMLRALYGYVFNDDSTSYGVVLSGHGPGKYNTGYYSHVYEWQVQQDINFTNGFDQQENIAWRNIGGSLTTQDGGELELSVNLDKERLL